MKMKKLLAGLLAGAMVLGCVPQSAWGEEYAKQVSAAETYGVTKTGLVDQVGRSCSFIGKFGNSTTTVNDPQSIFDYDETYCKDNGCFQVRGSSSDKVQVGDYIGLIYDTAFQMQKVRFVFAPDAPKESTNDRYRASKLQYLEKDTEEWVDVEGVTFDNQAICEATLPEDVQAKELKGIRLVNTDTATDHGAWIRVHEIAVNQENTPRNVFRYGFGTTGSTGLNQASGRVEVFFQGNQYSAEKATGFRTDSGAAGASLKYVIDGNRSTKVVLDKGDSSTDQITKGDYIAVIYNTLQPVNYICFLSDSTSTNDHFKKSDLQYTTDGTNWTTFKSYDNVIEVEVDEVEVASLRASNKLPEQVKGIRLLCTETDNNGHHQAWLRINEVCVKQNSADWEGCVPYHKMTATAGTEKTGQTKDLDASGALDGNTETWWHSKYNDDNSLTCKFWYDVKFDQPTWINGIKELPRATDGNGMITEYEVWVSNVDTPTTLPTITSSSSDEDKANYTKTWQSEYTKVCDGTWANNGDGTTVWKTATFEPVKAKHVRLVAIHTIEGSANNNPADKFVSMVEFRVMKADAETSFFKGGALRMDASEGQANLRLQYEFPQTLNGMTLKTGEWSWNYGTSLDGNGKIAGTDNKRVDENQYKLVDGTYYSNLVFKNITEANYGKSLYAQLVIPYANANNTETLNVYTSVEDRSVAGIATQIVDRLTGQEGKEAQVAYANTILQNKTMVQLGDDNTFSGEKVSVEKCEYTFTPVENTANTFTVSAKAPNGKTVYLNFPTNESSAVHSTTSANITFVDKGSSKFAPKLTKDNADKYLWFCYIDPLYFKAVNSNNADAEQCKYEIYKKVDEVTETQLIKGYERVTELSGITAGQYLIVHQNQAGTARYLLHPTTSSVNCNNTAKLLTGSSN